MFCDLFFSVRRIFLQQFFDRGIFRAVDVVDFRHRFYPSCGVPYFHTVLILFFCFQCFCQFFCCHWEGFHFVYEGDFSLGQLFCFFASQVFHLQQFFFGRNFFWSVFVLSSDFLEIIEQLGPCFSYCFVIVFFLELDCSALRSILADHDLDSADKLINAGIIVFSGFDIVLKCGFCFLAALKDGISLCQDIDHVLGFFCV